MRKFQTNLIRKILKKPNGEKNSRYAGLNQATLKGWLGKVSKVSKMTEVSIILKATNREAVRAVVAAHTGIATDEVQVPRDSSIYRTRPIEA